MAQMTGLNYKIQEMAHRIRELREIENFTIAEMAMKTGVTEQEYIDCEMGRSDLNFAFLYRCALAFGVDVGEIIVLRVAGHPAHWRVAPGLCRLRGLSTGEA